jgi:hypothetical protein
MSDSELGIREIEGATGMEVQVGMKHWQEEDRGSCTVQALS